MEFLKEWITNIILFILLATVIDMLLPNSNMQKYTKMVIGLLLITIILSPIFKLISSDFEGRLARIPSLEKTSDKKMGNLIEMKKKEIQASQHAYILETMAVQLEKDAKKELMDQYGLQIANIDISINEKDQRAFPGNLEKVIVDVQKPNPKSDAIEVIESVDISTAEPLPSKRNNDKAKIATLLSKKWNIDEQTIEVEMVEGGG
ncbi:stage III sporulation protein AF [Bacillus sp. 1NLA3E]|uniref:stage III sporulation protein AF n=1 Tax=Bacillus sp. 1NLA3E TaxID=666686 RepID=UPI000247E507|nr:stage III sporulation protein AF [Bacillus sp. 1NLA3E]AGK54844.1 stage III sporulation protein AF [Bacillus sp. 1NLA3E]